MRNIIAAFIGGAAFIVFFIVIQAPLFWALGASLAGWGGAILLSSASRRSRVITAQSPDRSQNLEMIDDALQQFKMIQVESARIKSPKTKLQSEEINQLIQKLFDTLGKNPENARVIRRFLTYYLETLAKLTAKYNELYEYKESSDKIQQTLTRIETLLDTVEIAVKKQLSRFLENDVMDIETELTLLEKTMKMDDL